MLRDPASIIVTGTNQQGEEKELINSNLNNQVSLPRILGIYIFNKNIQHREVRLTHFHTLRMQIK